MLNNNGWNEFKLLIENKKIYLFNNNDQSIFIDIKDDIKPFELNKNLNFLYKDIFLIKCDEDIVYLDDSELFKSFIEFRINNTNYYFITPCIINNYGSGKFLQKNNLIFKSVEGNGNIHRRPDSGRRLHKYFIDNIDKIKTTNTMEFSRFRHSINFITFLSNHLYSFKEFIGDDDEKI